MISHLKTTWILVIDGAHAYIAEVQGKDTAPKLIHQFSQEVPATHLHGNDSPGRAFESSGVGRHAYEPKHDWHTYQKELFAQHAAEVLNKSDTSFEDLIVIAPPKTLGALRDRFSKKVSDKIKHTVDKELTKLPLPELMKYLDEHFS